MCFDLVHLELPDLPESANTCFMAQYRIIDDQSFPTCLFLQLHYAEANKSTCPFHGELSRSSLLNFHNKCPVFPHTLMAGILWSCLVSYFQSNINRQWKLLKAGKGWGWKKLKCWLLAYQQYPIVSAFAPEKCVTVLCWPAVLQVRRSPKSLGTTNILNLTQICTYSSKYCKLLAIPTSLAKKKPSP